MILGAENFHLSQKLSTRYSAIAFQIGCPYLDIFNTVLVNFKIRQICISEIFKFNLCIFILYSCICFV